MLLKSWVLSLMLSLVPASPWSATYERTADAIAAVAREEPLFRGEHGDEHTAALLVSLASFESAFKPDALGDCGGREATRANCASWGLFQVNKHNFTVPAEFALEDPYIAAREAARLIRLSQRECRARPVEDMLGWYAWGRAGCEHSLEKSRHRVWLGRRLEREHPFPLDGV